MSRVYVAATLAALAGGSLATAQPLARHLLNDADVVEILHTDPGQFPTLANIASMFLLDDLDNDGVRDVLLTHATDLSGPGDYFRTVVRSSRAGKTLRIFPVDPSPAPFKQAHASAIQIDDVDADGVRDIAATRVHAGNLRPRVHSGATGAIIRDPFSSGEPFPWGLSLTPYGDHDNDGQTDLLLGRLPGEVLSQSYVVWSPQSGAAIYLNPESLNPWYDNVIVGVTILDLGVGASGAHELFTANLSPLAAQTQSSFQLFGRDPLTILGGRIAPVLGPQPPAGFHSGAARLGDLNADAHREIVLTGYLPSPSDPSQSGLPVISGNVETTSPPATIEPLTVHLPRMVVDRGAGPEVVETFASRALVGIADSTGDGLNDYAFIGTFDTGPDETSPCLVAMCGRTGQAFYASAAPTPDDFTTYVEFTRTIVVNGFVGQGALVSPGDINNDGSPDVFVLVYRETTSSDGSEFERTQLLLTHYLPTPCVGDTDFDRAVNFTDLNAVLSAFGAQDITSPADLNASGVVDFTDLNLVLSSFGQACD